MNLYDVLKKPIVSEKAEDLREKNIYAFHVALDANKTLIKQAIKKIYGVSPVKVNVLNQLPKAKANRYGKGYRSRTKKAYVILSKKDKIELFESV